MDCPVFSSACTLADKIRTRELTATDAVDSHLSQIAIYNSQINAIIRLDEEGARKRAEEADSALAEGKIWGPLHGVPFTLKDVHDTAMIETSHCHPSLAGRVPKANGVVARRLLAAGAIVLGKTNFQHYPGNPFGPTLNPWDTTRTIGGSSAGSAAAVAAGLSPFDVGSDIGGSIIAPAAFCGIYSMRPTEHRIPVSPCPITKIRLWRYIMTYGPLARSVEDLELTVCILAGPDEFDIEVPMVPWSSINLEGPNKLRIGWCHDFPKTLVDDDTAYAIESVVRDFERAGVLVKHVRPETPLWQGILTWSKLAYEMLLPVDGQYFQTADGKEPLLADYLKALEERDTFIRAWERFLSNFDAFLMPAFGVTTWALNAPSPPKNASLFAPLSAATGQPSIVMPISLSPHGLPIGAQLIGQRWRDEHLLSVARILAEFTPGYRRPPGF